MSGLPRLGLSARFGAPLRRWDWRREKSRGLKAGRPGAEAVGRGYWRGYVGGWQTKLTAAVDLLKGVRVRSLAVNRQGLVMRAGLLGLLFALCGAGALAAPVIGARLTSALTWRSVGPYSGGRVTSVSGEADDPAVFYAAYAGGGVWKSSDYGQRWHDISGSAFKSSNIGAIAVAPSDPKVVYAGLGDSAPRNTVLEDGNNGGVYKSTDGGKTWKFVGLQRTGVISWIVIDPKNPNVVYAAALGHVFAPNSERGVFKTTNGGRTWQKVLYINDKTGVITLAMDPTNPQVVYAGAWQVYRRPWTLWSGGPGSGIYKTTDGGAHWINITRNPGLPSGIMGKVGVAVAPSDPNVVYALVQAKVSRGHPGALYRSDNAGKTWRMINDSLNITQRAFYYGRVYVDPKNANTIYLPNVGVYVSHDGGKKLITLHPPHGDNHAFWINPENPNVLIEGDDGGATVSVNGGRTWSTEDNQPTGQFYHVNLDNQFPFRIYGAQQDRSSVVGPSAVARGGIPGVWRTIAGGEMSWVVPTPDEPWITYGSGYYSQEWRENRRTGIVSQVNAWGQWKFGSAADKLKYRFGWWHHPKVFAPHNPKELLIGANVVFETLDQGVHWKVISPDLTRNDKSKQGRPGGPINADVTGEETYDTLSVIAFSPLSDNVIWTGSDDGLVYLTTNGGEHWSAVRPPQMPKWAVVTSIEPSSTEEGTAYLSASRYMWDDFHPYVYKTSDYGKHWTEITTGLPRNQYVNAVRQDPGDPQLLLAGTSSSVYMSLDGGASWQSLKLNLPAVRVTDIEIQPVQHAVVLSTFGRGFWILDNLQFLEQLTSAQVTSSSPYLFRPQQAWLVSRRTGFRGHDAEGKNLPSGVTVFFNLPTNYRAGTPVTLSFTTAAGKLVSSYKLPLARAHESLSSDAKLAPLHPGMNRFQWNLRYPTAADITGIYESRFSQGPRAPVGPEVVPGTYHVVMRYRRSTYRQTFAVKLDPRLATTQEELVHRFNLLMKIQGAMGRLDTAVNAAVSARGVLEHQLSEKRVSGHAAQNALLDINRDVNSVVDLRIQSDEGSLVYPAKLRAWLSWLSGDIESSFLPVTPAFRAAANTYVAEAQRAVAKLRSDAARAKEATK